MLFILELMAAILALVRGNRAETRARIRGMHIGNCILRASYALWRVAFRYLSTRCGWLA